jgi:hypothetical protein
MLFGAIVNVVCGEIAVGVEVPKLIPFSVPVVADCVCCIENWLSGSLVCRLVHESSPVLALGEPVDAAVAG